MGRNKKDFTAQPVFSSKAFGQSPSYIGLLDLQKIKHRKITCKIGVVDSGVDGTHYELVDDLKKWVNFTNEKGSGLHGTAVAGTISSDSYGVVDIARILSYKSLSAKHGSGNFRDIARAIDQARKDGCTIINLSIGAQVGSAEVTVALDKFLQDSRNFAVIACGNDGGETDFPAWLADKYYNLIAVGAGRIEGKGKAILSSFSSRGVVTVTCQGEDVLTTVPGGSFQYLSGTSFAAPMVSAVIGLCKTIIPDFGAADFHKLMTVGGSVIDMMNIGRDKYTGYGFLLPYGVYKNAIRMKNGDIPRPNQMTIKSNVSWFTRFLCIINPLNWF